MNDENVKNELTKAAEILNMELSAIEEKWNEIKSTNGLGDDQHQIAITLFRQWFAGKKRVLDTGVEPTKTNRGNDNQTVFGYVVAVEDLRDFEQYNRDQLKAAIIRDENTTFNAGKYARLHKTETGYEVSQVMDNEVLTRPLNNTELPESVMEVNGNLIVPIDDQKFLFGKENKKYGHPKPLNNFQRGVHFIGSLEGKDTQYWRIGLKGDKAKNWNVDGERAVYIDVFATQDHLDSGNLYAPNLETVMYNDELENPQPANHNLQTLIAENMRGFVCPLINLENYHVNNKNRPAKERLVVTDGTVTNMYMNPNSNGNRTLYISDLNSEFDYDNPQGATPCWVPEHVNLDFGIGSQILVIGRSNQSQNQETGEMRQCSINVFGVIVLDKHGSPTTTQDSGETYTGWF